MSDITRRGKAWRAAVSFGGFNHTKTFSSFEAAAAWVHEQEAKVYPTIKQSIEKYAMTVGGVLRCNRYGSIAISDPISTDLPWRGRQKSTDLYVFQNELGMIKIGRSTSPAIRRENLEGSSGLRIYSVAVVRDGGDAEKRLHWKFKAHRGIGEWFVNCPEVRLGLAQELEMELSFPVPCSPAMMAA